MSYTRANKTCQGKLSRLCGALSQGKLVQRLSWLNNVVERKMLFIIFPKALKQQRLLEQKKAILIYRTSLFAILLSLLLNLVNKL